MLRIALLALALASCKPPCYDCGGRMLDPKTAAEGDARYTLCHQATALHDQKCGLFAAIDQEQLTYCTVVDLVFIETIERCMSEKSCAATTACIDKVHAEGGTYAGPTRGCVAEGRDQTIPAGFSAGDIERGYGLTAKKFSDAPSTKDQPIEVCGMPAKLDYLMRVTCDDNSRPLSDRDKAAHSRVGGGPGGRCGRNLDEHAVVCPEATYQVFIDPYRCPIR